MDAYDVAVVGGGPGGLAAATYARMRGLSVVLFEAESFGGQLVNLYPTKPVDNFPATDEVPSGELARRLADQAETFGAELAPFEPVEFVGHRDALFEVRTDRRGVLARTLILALCLGRFRPRKLGLLYLLSLIRPEFTDMGHWRGEAESLEAVSQPLR